MIEVESRLGEMGEGKQAHSTPLIVKTRHKLEETNQKTGSHIFGQQQKQGRDGLGNITKKRFQATKWDIWEAGIETRSALGASRTFKMDIAREGI